MIGSRVFLQLNLAAVHGPETMLLLLLAGRSGVVATPLLGSYFMRRTLAILIDLFDKIPLL